MEGPPNPDQPSTTYSLHGEDIAAIRTLERCDLYRDNGFYVDVGAFHPYWASNTALLHARGWRGINIEPNQAMAARLATARPGDATLACAAGPRGRAELHYFYDWASSNTLVADFADTIARTQGVQVAKRVEVDVVPLSDILHDHGPVDGVIDFLSVDVEGMDLEVLSSNDWDSFRPSLVAVEDLGISLNEPGASATFRFMRSRGYRLASHVVLTSLYIAP